MWRKINIKAEKIAEMIKLGSWIEGTGVYEVLNSPVCTPTTMMAQPVTEKPTVIKLPPWTGQETKVKFPMKHLWRWKKIPKPRLSTVCHQKMTPL